MYKYININVLVSVISLDVLRRDLKTNDLLALLQRPILSRSCNSMHSL